MAHGCTTPCLTPRRRKRRFMMGYLSRQFSMRLDEEVARQLDLIGKVNGGISRAKVIDQACRAYVNAMQADPRFVIRMRSYIERQRSTLERTAKEFMDASRSHTAGRLGKPKPVTKIRPLKEVAPDAGATDVG
jgi:hypothetical protein